MKTPHYLFLVLLILLLIWLVCKCGHQSYCPPVTPCQDSLAAPNRIDKQLIIELKNLYTKKDIIGEPDSFAICALGRFSGKPAGEEKDDCRFDCEVIDRILPTGKTVFLKELNDILFPIGTNQHINDFKVIDSCQCDEEIILIEVNYPDSVDIYSGVAGSSTETKENNNGSIGAIGFNYNLDDIASLNDAKLDEKRGTAPENCGFFIQGERGGEIEEKLRSLETTGDISVPDALILLRQRGDLSDEELDQLSNAYANCIPATLDPRKCLENMQDTSIVKVAVIDTGVDPFYNYRGTTIGGFSMSSLNQSFTFSPEAVSFLQSGLPPVFPYGEQIPGSVTDENGNCLRDDYYGYDYKGNDNNPYDVKGHGTHIVNTILTANLTGAKVRVMPLQFGDYQYSSAPADTVFKCDLFAAICSINYAVKNGADIINMSWGYFAPEVNHTLHNQIDRAAKAGILMVASVGNADRSVDQCPHWPSNYSTIDSIQDHVISVAALDTFNNLSELQLAAYSNYGNSVDVAAPGTDIASALVYSHNGTIELSGTSMAAGVISRRAAMLLIDNGQHRSAAEVKELILANCISKANTCINGGRVYNPYGDPLLIEAISN